MGAFEDEIELNRRLNETLEEMARALFRDWFVDFGPTRRQMEGATAPAAIMGHTLPFEKAATLAPLFPVKLGDNGLPEGWKLGQLDDWAVSASNTVKPDEVKQDTSYIGLEYMPRRSIALGQWETAAKVTSNKARFEKGQVLFGKLRPYFHKVGIAPCDGICSTDIVVADGRQREFRPFIATLMSTDEFVAYTNQSSTGTKMPRTSWKLMRAFEAPKAPKELVIAFGDLAQPMHDKILYSLDENQTLAALRALLLPKLMSGEIRLKDAKALEESEAISSNVVFANDMFGEPILTPEQKVERDEVLVAVNVAALEESERFVGNVRLMKSNYLVHRRMGWSTDRFERHAAGPHCRELNDVIRKSTIQKEWISRTSTHRSNGKTIRWNRSAKNYSDVEPLIDKYELRHAIDWLVTHFRGVKTDWMECVTTVDDAIQALNRIGTPITVESVKANIASTPEWKPKLSKSHFADSEIRKAIQKINEIF